MDSVYTDDVTFWHPALTVAGKQDMLGVARLWTFLFKDLEVDTRRVGTPGSILVTEILSYFQR